MFGCGNAAAELMFVGEGPGAEEDRQGLPFVGAAGELLNRIIQAIEKTRDEVYIANVVKCRPPGNRDPQPDEVTACRGYLDRQIALVRPRVLVALGKVAAQALLGNDSPHRQDARAVVPGSGHPHHGDLSPRGPAAKSRPQTPHLGGHAAGPRLPAGRLSEVLVVAVIM